MSHLPVVNDSVLNLLATNLNGQRILDLGCGHGAWGFLIRLKKQGRPTMTGIDVWKPFLASLRNTGLYDDLICADACHLPLKSNVFDVVLASEILEHLPYSKTTSFFKEIDAVCKARIILTTPKGFSKQYVTENNPYEEHKSGWQQLQLQNLRFQCRTIQDPNYLPEKLRNLINKLSKVFPPLQYKEIIAWRDRDPKR